MSKKNKKEEEFEGSFFGGVADDSQITNDKCFKSTVGEEIIDPITNKPIQDSFMDIHGDSIFDALDCAVMEKADAPLPNLTDDQMKRLESGSPLEYALGETCHDMSKMDRYIVDTHVDSIFGEQDQEYLKRVDDEIAEYKDNFEKLSNKIAEQEKIVSDKTDEFNDCKDKDRKIELFYEVNEEMAKLVKISSNFGNAIQKSDVLSVMDSLSSYDELYDEDTERTIIKNL